MGVRHEADLRGAAERELRAFVETRAEAMERRLAPAETGIAQLAHDTAAQ